MERPALLLDIRLRKGVPKIKNRVHGARFKEIY